MRGGVGWGVSTRYEEYEGQRGRVPTPPPTTPTQERDPALIASGGEEQLTPLPPRGLGVGVGCRGGV